MDLHGTGRRAPGFVLASASPARADLLRQIGLRFEVLPSKIREVILIPKALLTR